MQPGRLHLNIWMQQRRIHIYLGNRACHLGKANKVEMDTQLDIIDHAEDRPRVRRADDELDMTPMVDVTFLLLIFFMITAAFALQQSLEVPRMEEEDTAEAAVADDFDTDTVTVTVRIDADNIFWIGAPTWDEERRAASSQEMLVQLRSATTERGKRLGPTKMLVQANGDAVHEKVVAAVDAGMDVGMENIQLLSYEEGDL